MTITQLTKIFQANTHRPTTAQGDPYGIEATSEQILELIDADPDSLKAHDFVDYLGYCTTGGDADLRYLLPPILRIWESSLYEPDSWFTNYFHAELGRTNIIIRALNPKLREAVYAFMVKALSQKISTETALSVEGKSPCHDWFGHLASFGVFTTEIETLWTVIWESEQSGHAIALLQYLSCLIYEESNPIFAPWTCDKGGGPPGLWEFDSIGFDEAWQQENLNFMASALTPQRIAGWLKRTAQLHAGKDIAEFANYFLHELSNNSNEVDERIKLLLIALKMPSGIDCITWESLRHSIN